jgi:hypothetical protein
MTAWRRRWASARHTECSCNRVAKPPRWLKTCWCTSGKREKKWEGARPMTFSFALRHDNGQLHVEIATDPALAGQLLGSLLPLLSAPMLPLPAAPPPPQAKPLQAKPPARQRDGNGHKIVEGKMCAFCGEPFAGRSERKFCGRKCQNLAALVKKPLLPEPTETGTADRPAPS